MFSAPYAPKYTQIGTEISAAKPSISKNCQYDTLRLMPAVM